LPGETEFTVRFGSTGLWDDLGDVKDVEVSFCAGVFTAEGCCAHCEEGATTFGFFGDLEVDLF
jgi:hypothetical protein